MKKLNLFLLLSIVAFGEAYAIKGSEISKHSIDQAVAACKAAGGQSRRRELNRKFTHSNFPSKIPKGETWSCEIHRCKGVSYTLGIRIKDNTKTVHCTATRQITVPVGSSGPGSGTGSAPRTISVTPGGQVVISGSGPGSGTGSGSTTVTIDQYPMCKKICNNVRDANGKYGQACIDCIQNNSNYVIDVGGIVIDGNGTGTGTGSGTGTGTGTGGSTSINISAGAGGTLNVAGVSYDYAALCLKFPKCCRGFPSRECKEGKLTRSRCTSCIGEYLGGGSVSVSTGGTTSGVTGGVVPSGSGVNVDISCSPGLEEEEFQKCLQQAYLISLVRGRHDCVGCQGNGIAKAAKYNMWGNIVNGVLGAGVGIYGISAFNKTARRGQDAYVRGLEQCRLLQVALQQQYAQQEAGYISPEELGASCAHLQSGQAMNGYNFGSPFGAGIGAGFTPGFMNGLIGPYGFGGAGFGQFGPGGFGGGGFNPGFFGPGFGLGIGGGLNPGLGLGYAPGGVFPGLGVGHFGPGGGVFGPGGGINIGIGGGLGGSPWGGGFGSPWGGGFGTNWGNPWAGGGLGGGFGLGGGPGGGFWNGSGGWGAGLGGGGFDLATSRGANIQAGMGQRMALGNSFNMAGNNLFNGYNSSMIYGGGFGNPAMFSPFNMAGQFGATGNMGLAPFGYGVNGGIGLNLGFGAGLR